jgi:hypothetical protein
MIVESSRLTLVNLEKDSSLTNSQVAKFKAALDHIVIRLRNSRRSQPLCMISK